MYVSDGRLQAKVTDIQKDKQDAGVNMAKQTESTEKKEKERTLEEAFLRLDEIIQKLEKKDTTLEDSFLGYQEGIELIKFCNQQIDTVEKKILVLNEEGEADEF